MANHSLVENVNSVINTFNQAKAALVEKGVEVSSLATDIPSEIAKIESGGEAGYYRYFNTTLSTSNKTFKCGFRPLKVMCTLKSGDTTYFSMAINDNGTTRGSRYGSAQANGESAINITLTDNGFTASVINTNYNGNAEFIAVSDQEPEPSGGSNSWYGTVTIGNDATLTPVEVDTGLKNITRVMWFCTNNNYAANSFRNRQCGMWDSVSNKVTALRAGLSTSNAAGVTVTMPTLNVGGSLANIVNIHTMDAANGKFSFKAAANSNVYWGTFHVIAIAEDNPVTLDLDEE